MYFTCGWVIIIFLPSRDLSVSPDLVLSAGFCPYPSIMFLFQIWPLVSKHEVNKSTSLSRGYHENVLLYVSVCSVVSRNCAWNRVCFHGPSPHKHINTELSAGRLALPQQNMPFPALLLDTSSSLTTCDCTAPVVAGTAQKSLLVLCCICGQVKNKLVFRDVCNCSWCWV